MRKELPLFAGHSLQSVEAGLVISFSPGDSNNRV